MYTLLIPLLIATLLLHLVQRLRLAWFTPLSHLPNAHFTVPFSSLWSLLNKYHSRENHARHLAHLKYGPIVRIGPREVSVNCVKDGLTLVYSGKFDRPDWYSDAFRGSDDTEYLLMILEYSTHLSRKKMLTSIYTKSYIQKSARLQAIASKIMQQNLRMKLHEWATTHEVVNVFTQSKSCLMDLTSAWLFGLSQGTNFLRHQDDAEIFYRDFKDSSRGFFWRSETPRLTTVLTWFGLHLVPMEAKRKRLLVEEWCEGMCGKALEKSRDMKKDGMESEEKGDSNGIQADDVDYPLVYSHLREKLEHSSPPQPNIDQCLRLEMLDHLIAGHEGSGFTMTYILYEISLHPAIQKSLREELRSLPSESTTAHALNTLPLLNSIVLESMRVHPTAPGPWPRRSPTSTVLRRPGFPDLPIPKGTTFSASAYTLHKNEAVFPEPMEWRPERWMQVNEEQRREMDRWWWGFGSGSWICPGRHFALFSMKKILETIYREFETSIVDAEGIEAVDWVVAGPKGEKLMLTFRKVEDEG